jgi:hypothetical protein
MAVGRNISAYTLGRRASVRRDTVGRDPSCRRPLWLWGRRPTGGEGVMVEVTGRSSPIRAREGEGRRGFGGLRGRLWRAAPVSLPARRRQRRGKGGAASGGHGRVGGSRPGGRPKEEERGGKRRRKRKRRKEKKKRRKGKRK